MGAGKRTSRCLAVSLLERLDRIERLLQTHISPAPAGWEVSPPRLRAEAPELLPYSDELLLADLVPQTHQVLSGDSDKNDELQSYQDFCGDFFKNAEAKTDQASCGDFIKNDEPQSYQVFCGDFNKNDEAQSGQAFCGDSIKNDEPQSYQVFGGDFNKNDEPQSDQVSIDSDRGETDQGLEKIENSDLVASDWLDKNPAEFEAKQLELEGIVKVTSEVCERLISRAEADPDDARALFAAKDALRREKQAKAKLAEYEQRTQRLMAPKRGSAYRRTSRSKPFKPPSLKKKDGRYVTT